MASDATLVRLIGAGRLGFAALCLTRPRAAAASILEPPDGMSSPAAISFAALTGTRAGTLGILEATSPSLDPRLRRRLLAMLAAMDGIDTVGAVVRTRRAGRLAPMALNGAFGALLVAVQLRAAFAD